MANEHTREGRFKRDHGGFALAGIILAYFASPLLGKSDPVLLLILGGSLGLTVLSGSPARSFCAVTTQAAMKRG